TNPGNGTLIGTLTLTASTGVAVFADLSIDRAATGYQLSASSSGLASATSASFSITSGPASQLVVNAPSTATAGVGFSVTVTAQDSFGNTATGYAGTVHFTT